MSKVLEYTIYITLGLAFMFFIGYIEMLQINLKKKKELEKRIGRAKMFMLNTIFKYNTDDAKELYNILDGKDELGGKE